jgi:uncharacterized protein (TIGR02284 family)
MNTSRAEIRNEKIDTLNDLIQATRDGAAFYTDAAQKVGDPALSSLFEHMAHAKNGLVGAMSKEVQQAGAKAAASGTVGAALRALYGESLRAMGMQKSDFSYLEQLEKSEDQLMGAFHDVIKSDSASPQVKKSVAGYLDTVSKQHDSLRDCKWALEARNRTH